MILHCFLSFLVVRETIKIAPVHRTLTNAPVVCSQVPEENGKRSRAQSNAGDQRSVRGASAGRAPLGGGSAQREIDEDHHASAGHEVHIGAERPADGTALRRRPIVPGRNGHGLRHPRGGRTVAVAVVVVRAARLGRARLLLVAVHVRRRGLVAQRVRHRSAGRRRR